MPTTTVEQGVELHHVDEGGGDPATVMLHGFGLRAEAWRQQIRSIAPSRRVVAPDLRGFGDSDPSADPSATTIDDYASDVARLIDELGMERVVLVGHCLGAYVALDVMRLFPDRVGALVLASAPYGPLPDEERSLAEQRRWLTDGGDIEYFADWVRDTLVHSEGATRSEVSMVLRNSLRQAPREGLVGALYAMERRADAVGDVEKIEVPTLLLCGEDDRLVDMSSLEEFAAPIHDSRIEQLPYAAHFPPLEAPGPFTTRVVDFVAGNAER